MTREHAPVAAAANGLSLADGPRIVFRSTAPDSKGHLAMVAKDHPDGPRSVSTLTCLRVYAAGGTGTCLRQDGALSTFQIAILDRNLTVDKAIPLVRVPNRTRVSADGRMVAWTVFVAGDSYNHGRFSTRAGLIDLKTQDMVDSLEFLSVTLDGHPYAPSPRTSNARPCPPTASASPSSRRSTATRPTAGACPSSIWPPASVLRSPKPAASTTSRPGWARTPSATPSSEDPATPTSGQSQPTARARHVCSSPTLG